ncbi:unnamed protein product [Amoebophrya sp. A120]|nr:unnamed protein product [Amoebophrya sp. A120]|eukprot:GSA120T00021197001.1
MMKRLAVATLLGRQDFFVVALKASPSSSAGLTLASGTGSSQEEEGHAELQASHQSQTNGALRLDLHGKQIASFLHSPAPSPFISQDLERVNRTMRAIGVAHFYSHFVKTVFGGQEDALRRPVHELLGKRLEQARRTFEEKLDAGQGEPDRITMLDGERIELGEMDASFLLRHVFELFFEKEENLCVHDDRLRAPQCPNLCPPRADHETVMMINAGV